MKHHILQALSDIATEVEQAVARYPGFNSAHEGHSVVQEEYEELWEHVKADTGYSEAAYKEAMQLAAMAVRYMVMVKERQMAGRADMKGTL